MKRYGLCWLIVLSSLAAAPQKAPPAKDAASGAAKSADAQKGDAKKDDAKKDDAKKDDSKKDDGKTGDAKKDDAKKDDAKGDVAKSGSSNDQELMQGTWKAILAEEDGQPVDRIKGDRLVFAGDKVVIKKANGDPDEEGTFTLDATKKPKTIDLKPVKGPALVKGVYLLDGNTLKICIAKQGERPSDLATKVGSSTVLITLERQPAQ